MTEHKPPIKVAREIRLKQTQLDPTGSADRENTMILAGIKKGRQMERENRPRIICLCGSTRFIEHFAILAWKLEKGGAIVLGLHLLPTSYTEAKDHLAEFEGVKDKMDALHLRKIDLADKVVVLNIGGYIGESTTKEIAHAKQTGKPVYYLEALKGGK